MITKFQYLKVFKNKEIDRVEAYGDTDLEQVAQLKRIADNLDDIATELRFLNDNIKKIYRSGG